MKLQPIYLDLSPDYIPFMIQATTAAGASSNPTVDSLIIYEEGGANAVFDSTTVTGSPFDPAQVNSKTGLWGVLVAKSVFTAGRFYVALWEMTVDSVATSKVEIFFATNASSFKADVSLLALEATAQDILTDTGTTLPASLASIQSAIDNVGSISLISTNLVDMHKTAEDEWIMITAFIKDTDGLPFDPADITPDGDPRLYNGVGMTISDEETNQVVGYQTEGGSALDQITLCHHTAQSNKPQLAVRMSAGHYHFWLNKKDLTVGRLSMEVGMFNITQASASYGATYITDTNPTSHIKQSFNVTVSLPDTVVTGAYQITTQIYETATTTGIPDYVLSIYDLTNTVFQGKVTTNASGIATLNLDAGTYKVRGRKAGYTPVNTSETLSVSGDGSVTYYADTTSIPAPESSDSCRVYEYCFLPDDTTPMVSVTATAEINVLPYDLNSKLHSGKIVNGTYDSATGLVYWDLPKGASVTFFIRNVYPSYIDRTVPDETTVRLYNINDD